MVSGEAAQAWRNVSERAILNQTAASWGTGTRAPWLCSCWGKTQVQPRCWGHIPGCHRAIWVQEPPQQPLTGILSRCSHRSQRWGQGDSGPGAHAWWKTFPLLHCDTQLIASWFLKDHPGAAMIPPLHGADLPFPGERRAGRVGAPLAAGWQLPSRCPHRPAHWAGSNHCSRAFQKYSALLFTEL